MMLVLMSFEKRKKGIVMLVLFELQDAIHKNRVLPNGYKLKNDVD